MRTEQLVALETFEDFFHLDQSSQLRCEIKLSQVVYRLTINPP